MGPPAPGVYIHRIYATCTWPFCARESASAGSSAYSSLRALEHVSIQAHLHPLVGSYQSSLDFEFHRLQKADDGAEFFVVRGIDSRLQNESGDDVGQFPRIQLLQVDQRTVKRRSVFGFYVRNGFNLLLPLRIASH